MPDAAPSNLLVLDLETTGLDLAHDRILEVAAVVVTADLTAVVDHLDCVVRRDGTSVRSLIANSGGTKVIGMHTQSGLLGDLSTGIVERDVRAALGALVNRWPDALLTGSGVGRFDRPLLARQWPETVAPLTRYYELDLRSVREFVRLYCPDIPPYRPLKAHRAMADVQDTIGELRYYANALRVDVDRLGEVTR